MTETLEGCDLDHCVSSFARCASLQDSPDLDPLPPIASSTEDPNMKRQATYPYFAVLGLRNRAPALNPKPLKPKAFLVRGRMY